MAKYAEVMLNLFFDITYDTEIYIKQKINSVHGSSESSESSELSDFRFESSDRTDSKKSGLVKKPKQKFGKMQ